MGSSSNIAMQTGSGTWDIEPSATIKGQRGRFGWGAQATYRLRAEHRNNSGYRLGNKALVTGWLSTGQTHSNVEPSWSTFCCVSRATATMRSFTHTPH